MIKFSRIASVFVATTLVSAIALAAYPSNVTAVKSEKGKSVTFSGKLESGQPIADLSWASNSSVACFPATQNAKFRANHVLFSTDIPQQSIMTITLIPKDPKADMSIYAYTNGTTDFHVPPALPSCVSCEAEYKWDYKKKGKTQDHTRTVTLNATTHPYNVVIGVSGPAGATGEFDVKVDIK